MTPRRGHFQGKFSVFGNLKCRRIKLESLLSGALRLILFGIRFGPAFKSFSEEPPPVFSFGENERAHSGRENLPCRIPRCEIFFWKAGKKRMTKIQTSGSINVKTARPLRRDVLPRPFLYFRFRPRSGRRFRIKFFKTANEN